MGRSRIHARSAPFHDHVLLTIGEWASSQHFGAMTVTVTDKAQARRLFIDLAKRRVQQGSAFHTPARSLAYTILAAFHSGRTASLGEIVEALKKMSFEAKTHAARRS